MNVEKSHRDQSSEQIRQHDLSLLMISGPGDGTTGIGDYTDELTESMTSIQSKTAAFPVESKNPLEYLRPLRHVLRDDFDVVHVQHEYGMFGPLSTMAWFVFPCLYLLCWVTDTDVVLTVHEGLNKELVTAPHRSLKQIYIEMMNRCITVGADHVIFLSLDTKRRFTASVDVGSFTVLPHGVNTSRHVECSQEEAKRIFGYDPDDTVVSEPGYVEPRKGTEHLVEIAEQLPDVEFLVAGGPSGDAYEEYYTRIKRRAPDNLRVTGRLSETEFHAAFVASDLVVLPYQTAEQRGVVNKMNQSGIFNRCAAYETPVLAADLEYFSLLREEWHCVRTQNFDDVDATACAVERLLEDATALDQMTENLSEYATANSFQKVAEEHTAVYRELQI